MGPVATLRPVPGRPVLFVDGNEPLIVAADIHLGLGSLSLTHGPPIAGRAETLAEGLLAAGRETGATKVLLVGDVKDPISPVPYPTRTELREFFGRLLDGGMGVEVVMGNHDPGLPRWAPAEVVLHPATGLLRDGVGYFHGHAWPSAALLRRASTLVVGHLHPSFRLAPSEARSRTGKEPCWIRASLRGPTPRERARRRRHPWPRAREMIVLPAYNPLCSGEALNREAPGRGRTFLVRRFLQRGEARAFLLDGTDVGTVTWSPPRK